MPLETVVNDVPVRVTFVAIVVGLRKVPVDIMTVGCAEDVGSVTAGCVEDTDAVSVDCVEDVATVDVGCAEVIVTVSVCPEDVGIGPQDPQVRLQPVLEDAVWDPDEGTTGDAVAAEEAGTEDPAAEDVSTEDAAAEDAAVEGSESTTTIELMVTIVGTGTLMIVKLETTVSKVEIGKVKVAVIERGDAEARTL